MTRLSTATDAAYAAWLQANERARESHLRAEDAAFVVQLREAHRAMGRCSVHTRFAFGLSHGATTDRVLEQMVDLWNTGKVVTL